MAAYISLIFALGLTIAIGCACAAGIATVWKYIKDLND